MNYDIDLHMLTRNMMSNHCDDYNSSSHVRYISGSQVSAAVQVQLHSLKAEAIPARWGPDGVEVGWEMLLCHSSRSLSVSL